MSKPDYTAWPEIDDVEARLAAAGIVLRGESGSTQVAERINAAIDEVAAEVARRTLRQFVCDSADTPTTRYYDGSGTSRMEIDEFVAFVGAAAIGLQADPGYPLDNCYPVVEQGKPTWAITRGQGGLPAFQVAGVYQPLPTIFPAGRQNIAVTAQFGYAAAIPADLWHHVCGEIARRVAVEAIFQAEGRLILKKRGDAQENYSLKDVDALGWQEPYERDVTRIYKKPVGRRMRSMRPAMI